MQAPTTKTLAAPLALLLLAALGCGSIGLPGGGTPAPAPAPADQEVIAGDVSHVDTAQQEIEIDDRGRRHIVRYDRSTRVLYEGREYRPEALERGDVVRVRVEEGRFGGLYADQVDVVESVQDRQDDPYDDRHGQDRLTGTVEWIDARRGEFGLRTDDREMVTVEVPFDARDSTRSRFAALDRGDYVRIEAESVERGRVELVRFL